MDEVKYVCNFKLPSDFLEVGAVRVENLHNEEIYFNTIALSYRGATTTITCNSWVQPKKDGMKMRVFFINKTPNGIEKLRKRELESLRGEGTNEDEQHGEDHETITDEPYYVPRDEAFSSVKSDDFEKKKLLSAIHGAIPLLMASKDSNLPFPNFNKIDSLFDVDAELPQHARSLTTFGFIDSIQNLRKKLKQLYEILTETKGPILHFEAPEMIIRDRFSWLRDEEFARQTLAGLNPLSIELVTEWPLKSKLDPKYGPLESAITNEIVEKQNDGVMTVEQAIKNKKLFMIDYHDLLLPYVKDVRKLEGTTLYGSRTLFFLREDDTLMPIAIELTRPVIDTEPHWRHVFTPSSDATNLWLWRVAKVHVLAHDSAYHQLISHWLRTHCCMEPYIIAANRQLSVMHPIYKLLHPHFLYTMEINAFARQNFFPKRYSMELSFAAYDQLWRFDEEALPADLIRRGRAVEDQTAEHGVKLTIEDYPYGKDGLELWKAIKTWVTDYINIYYQDENAIQTDTELQAWWTEYDYAGYFPNRPTIARTNVPIKNFSPEFDNLIRKPEDELLKCFPSQLQAIMVMIVLDLLSTHSSDEKYIGDKLEPVWSEDKQVEAIFNMFKARLMYMNGLIQARNSCPKLKNRTGAGVTPYKLLEQLSGPGVTGKGVPNSVSI
ncbi:hypothetical protein AQUCO_00900188v1 [Aquilegia coerulea]|uniref:Lipoxygenase n=1 Tax=Aquilegia coerulea TaxID=218851 RepID=A0A2G5ECJ8_AQUCA|nr:hypothetical protein AQUCO_00900188v1 [Aquilegia coerulea]